jgi:outer membrane protein TolC
VLFIPALAMAQDDGDAKPGIELREAPGPSMAKDPLAAHPGGLTAAEVAKKAMTASPLVAGRQAELEVAGIKIDEAAIQFYPRLTFRGNYARISKASTSLGDGALVGAANPGPILVGPCNAQVPNSPQCAVDTQGLPLQAFQFSIPVNLNTYGLSAQLGLPLSDYLLRLSKTLAATYANERAAKLNKQAERLKAATDGSVAYYNWTRSVASLTVAESALVRISQLQKDTQAAFSAGTSTKADVLRVDALAASTELTIASASSMKSLATEQLGVLMGVPVADWQVGEDIRADTAHLPDRPPLPPMIDEAFKQRLELRALESADVALGKAASATRMGELPRLDAFGQYDVARPNSRYAFDPSRRHSSWAVGLALSWTVNDTFANSASARQLEANRRKLAADLDNAKRGLQMEVTSSYLDEKKARVALSTAQRGLKAAQEAYRVAVDLYRVGRARTTDLIAAEQELLSASLNEVNAAIDARLAVVRLEHAVGRDAGKLD